MTTSFTWMAVLDSIYHQVFFTANSLGRQPATSQCFQLLTPQTLALATAAIHCALSDYACGTKATVKFSQEEYRYTFCPSPEINVTPEATALINHTLAGRLIHPLRCNSATIGAPQFWSALLSPDWCSAIQFRKQFPTAHLRLDCCLYIEFCSLYLPSPSPFCAAPLV